jgi:hypothetical protein
LIKYSLFAKGLVTAFVLNCAYNSAAKASLVVRIYDFDGVWEASTDKAQMVIHQTSSTVRLLGRDTASFFQANCVKAKNQPRLLICTGDGLQTIGENPRPFTYESRVIFQDDGSIKETWTIKVQAELRGKVSANGESVFRKVSAASEGSSKPR